MDYSELSVEALVAEHENLKAMEHGLGVQIAHFDDDDDNNDYEDLQGQLAGIGMTIEEIEQELYKRSMSFNDRLGTWMHNA